MDIKFALYEVFNISKEINKNIYNIKKSHFTYAMRFYTECEIYGLKEVQLLKYSYRYKEQNGENNIKYANFVYNEMIK